MIYKSYFWVIATADPTKVKKDHNVIKQTLKEKI